MPGRRALKVKFWAKNAQFLSCNRVVFNLHQLDEICLNQPQIFPIFFNVVRLRFSFLSHKEVTSSTKYRFDSGRTGTRREPTDYGPLFGDQTRANKSREGLFLDRAPCAGAQPGGGTGERRPRFMWRSASAPR